jgi:hypothetical protein
LSAHEEIQLKHGNWKFDWANVVVGLTEGQEFYQPNDVWFLESRNWDFDSMYVYRTAEGPTSRTWLSRVDYNTYRQIRVPSAIGRPIYVTWVPSKELGLYPLPSAGMTFVADYYLKPQILVSNTDTPRIPDEYHMAIVWRAVMMWCASEENPALYQTASANYNSLLLKMEQTELEGPLGSEPLA